jgi:hypothetical protein
VWRVVAPKASAVDVFEVCAESQRDAGSRSRMMSASPSVQNADERYDSAGRLGRLHELEPKDFAGENVQPSEMVKLYDRSFAAQGSAGRIYYDVIKLAPKYGLCPMCGLGSVASLDHFLPKSSFSALTVNPHNLVPACMECNKTKSDKISGLVHPYFDSVDSSDWLVAEIVEGPRVRARFYVITPEAWSAELALRVRNHFDVFGLNRRYGAEAAVIFSGLRSMFGELHTSGGQRAVMSNLEASARSWSSYARNCWQAALYAAMAGSAWYCDGGFDAFES